ncbi:MAG TPA: hypothetical protein VGD81_19365 [Opitutaceae bacterium]
MFSNLRAQVFTYTFADVLNGTSDSSAGGSADHMTFSSFTAEGVSTQANAGGVFSFTGWPTGAKDGSDEFSGTLNAAAYYEFTITPEAGYALSLTSLTFGAGRSSTGPRQFSLRSNAGADGFATNLTGAASNTNISVTGGNIFQFVDNNSSSTYAGNSVTLTGGDFTDVTAAITFRLYAFNAEAGGSFRIDNFAISGSASAIPEPSTYVTIAAICAFAGVLGVRRRHGS